MKDPRLTMLARQHPAVLPTLNHSWDDWCDLDMFVVPIHIVSRLELSLSIPC